MTPGPEDEVSQDEKRRIIREQATTMHQHAQAQADEMSGGRFAATGTPNVTGATPVPSYPAASTSWQIQLPDEPPLGFDNPALEPSADNAFPVEKLGAPVAAAPSSEILPCPSAGDVETSTGASPFSEQTNE
jgi:hypothetical protein